MYAVGTLISLAGTGFLIGFKTQLKLVCEWLSIPLNPTPIEPHPRQMFKPVRIVATIVFLAMIGLIFVGAFVIKIDVSLRCTLPKPKR